MTTDILQTDISKLLGVDSLAEEEQAEFLEQIGETVLEAALLRLVAGLNEEEEEQLNAFLDKNPIPRRLLQHLLSHYQNFAKILDEEALAFKEEVVAVMPAVEDDKAEMGN